MLYKLGRLLQLVGLVILPVAIAGNVVGGRSLWESLLLSGVGVVVFLAGRLIQNAGQPR